MAVSRANHPEQISLISVNNTGELIGRRLIRGADSVTLWSSFGEQEQLLCRQSHLLDVEVGIMLNCPTCGYESPDSARFCRQCGAPLLAESDLLEATTQHYGKQGPAFAAAASAPLPPSIGDAVAGDTARYQQPSPPAYAPPGRVQPAVNTASLKSKRRYLKRGGFVLALLISGGIGAAINEESNSNRIQLSAEDRVRLERLRTEDQIRQTLTGSMIEHQERAREELERRLEAVERAKEESERAAERGDVTTTGEKPLDLTAYEYPGASAGQYSRIPGRELLTQRTQDDFETVSGFYQEKLGRPFVQVSERNRKQVLFQSAGTPSITVLVRESHDRSRQPEIIILRSPFRFLVAQPDPEKPGAEESRRTPAESKQKAAR